MSASIRSRLKRAGFTLHKLSARASRNRRHRPARLALVGVLLLAVVLLGGNVANAATAPRVIPTVPAVALPALTPATQPGTFVQVASIATAPVRFNLSLARDPSGRSFGCVSLNPVGTTPINLLPNSPTAMDSVGTFCALRSPNGTNSGPGVGYEILLDHHLPAADQGAIAFGYVPAGTSRVRIGFAKRGSVFFRHLKPNTSVLANVFGGSLHLPIKAWAGPNISGYRVTSIQAINQAGVVTASINF